MEEERKDGKKSLSKTVREQNLRFSVEFDDGENGELAEEVVEVQEDDSAQKTETESDEREKSPKKETNVRKRPDDDDEEEEDRQVKKRSEHEETAKENKHERRPRHTETTRKKESDQARRSKSRSPEVGHRKKQNLKRGAGDDEGDKKKTKPRKHDGEFHLPAVPERYLYKGGVKNKEGKEEIPIYARIRGPGPAHYLLPTTIGRNQVDNTKRASPAFSFGHRSWSFKSDSPGPAYCVDPLLGPKGREAKPSYSFGVRPRTPVRKNDTPGPGAYNTDVSPLWEKRAPQYSLSNRNKQRPIDHTPSPNIYKLPPMIGDRVPHVKGGPAVSMSPRRERHGFAEDLSKTPGPAAYGMFSPSLTKPKPPEYTVKGRNFNNAPKDNFPGPGSYSPENVSGHLEQSPRHVIGVRHSEFKMPTITPADITN